MNESIELAIRDIVEELKAVNSNLEKLNAEIKHLDMGIYNSGINISDKLDSIARFVRN